MVTIKYQNLVSIIKDLVQVLVKKLISYSQQFHLLKTVSKQEFFIQILLKMMHLKMDLEYLEEYHLEIILTNMVE